MAVRLWEYATLESAWGVQLDFLIYKLLNIDDDDEVGMKDR